MAVSLKWLPRATADLEELASYIRSDNPAAATAFVASLIDRVYLLREFPELGRVIPDFNERNIRELIFRQYRIPYRYLPGRSTIEIIRVWRFARGTPKL